MVDYAHPERPSERLSHAERDAAVADLRTHESDGRITSVEFDERSAAAASAVTRGDLAPLFADLPVLGGELTGRSGSGGAWSGGAQAGSAQSSGGAAATGVGQAAADTGQPGAGQSAAQPQSTPSAGTQTAPPPAAARQPSDRHYRSRQRGWGGRGRPLGGRIGASVMAATPVVTVLLFFITGLIFSFAWSWLWFLAVPVVGAIIYAPWYEDDDE